MTIELSPNPKQREFFLARNRFVAYGGARGGGKSWAVRSKAALLALRYGGIRILILRRSHPELFENHILPLSSLLEGAAKYKDSEKAFIFPNGSRIRFGYCDGERDVLQYQGQEFDVVFIDEATQFSEFQFRTLTACVRGANTFPKRMYLTCNPGGVGHAWVKRLFLERAFKGSETPSDYLFIPARVWDNEVLMKQDPGYIKMLDNLPPGLREAWRDGSWDVFAGQYFTEWERDVHVIEPFDTPPQWRYYVSLDYGLDMLAAYLIAVDREGFAYVTREAYEGRDRGNGAAGLTISEAAERLLRLSSGVRVCEWLAPPDMWNARQESGKSVADIFAEYGIYLNKTSSERVHGWLAVKEWLKIFEDAFGNRSSRLKIFKTCENLIRTLPQLQYDEKRPSDVSAEPHELTHAPDALRGFCVCWSSCAALENAGGKKVKLINKFGERRVL